MALRQLRPEIKASRREPRPSGVAVEQDIITAILSGRERGSALKAVGSRGSKNGCYQSPGTAVCLNGYDKVLSVRENLVTAQAGATVEGFNSELRRHGLALSTHGEWSGATLAGAASTGTHGGSRTHGVFSNSIDSVRIITSEGEVWEVGRDSAAFDHVALSLGALGIISTITFRCEEKFFLELQMRVVPFERFLLERETLDEDNEFFSAVWSPYAGRVLTFQGNRVPNQPRSGSRRERFCLLHCIHHQISRLPCLGAFPLRWSGLTVVDECYRILSPIQKKSGKTRVLRTLGKLVRAVEFAVPLSKAGELLTALHGLLLSENWAVPLPIGLRASAKDSLSLSPAFGRDSFWIDMFLFPDSRLEKSLAGLFEEFDARCHWGKHIGLSRDHLLRQYPRWEEFWTFRNSLDPDRIFANDFTRSLEP